MGGSSGIESRGLHCYRMLIYVASSIKQIGIKDTLVLPMKPAAYSLLLITDISYSKPISRGNFQNMQNFSAETCTIGD